MQKEEPSKTSILEGYGYIKKNKDHWMNQADNKKSLIVIGAGLTGLSAALTWATFNDCTRNPVVLIDKNRYCGGYVTTYKRKDFHFDTCQMISNLVDVFKFFDLNIPLSPYKEDFLQLILADPQHQNHKQIRLPNGIEAFYHFLLGRYPDETKALTRFYKQSHRMFQELYTLKYDPNYWEMFKMLIICPKIVIHASHTFEEYLDRFSFINEELKEILRVFATFSGIPHTRIAVLLHLGIMFSLLESAYRTQGYFKLLPDTMLEKYLQRGGEVRLKTRVEKILIDHNKVRGVVLDNKEEILSDKVITTVDVKHSMEELVGLEKIHQISPTYHKKLQSIAMTPSSFNINLGLDDRLDLSKTFLIKGYNLLTTGMDDYKKLYQLCQQGKIGYTQDCFHVGVISPSMSIETKSNLNISVVPFPAGNWISLRNQDKAAYQKLKNQWAVFFVKLVERYLIPNLSKHIQYQDVSTPATLHRYSGSPSASIYDMESVPDNFGKKRLPITTPIKGLYQPKFSHGVFGTIIGGMQAVDLIMNRKIMKGNARLPMGSVNINTPLSI